MSKKAVIELNEEELELLDTLLWRGIDESPSDDTEDGVKLNDSIEEQAKKNRSIIEWHGMDEVPSIGEQIFVCYKDGHIGTDVAVGHTTLAVGLIKWHLKHENIENVNLWARLPKDFKWESLI